MSIKMGIISATAGATLLGGVGVAALAGGSSAPAATAVLTAATSASPAPATGPTTSSCSVLKDDGGWPPEVQGTPAGFDANDRAAVYLWHDDDGWHLRVTHRGDDRQGYSGTLVTGGTFSDVNAVKLEKDDSFKVGPDGHVLTFHFVNYGGVDGLNFRTHCAERIGFGFRGDGDRLPTSMIHVGHDADHPASDPFVVRRVES